MKYLDQSVNSLRLYALCGDPNINQFTILAQDSFVWNNNVITFGILGESHYLTISNQEKTFSEICACTPAIFSSPTTEVLTSGYLNELAVLPFVTNCYGFQYTFKYNFFDLKRADEYLTDLRQVKAKGDTHFLHYNFPSRWFFMKKAVTEIFIKTTHDQMHLRTVHTYPNHKLAALTSSSFKIISR